jgi:hypothetical protein
MKSDSNSKEALAKRADASFKKEERSKEAKLGVAAYETAAQAVAAKTERLRALRLAKEAAELVEATKVGNTARR